MIGSMDYGEWIHFQGKQLCHFHFCLSWQWELTLRRIAPRSKFFPSREDTIFE